MKLGMSSKNLESLGFFEVLASISCRSIHLQKDQFSSMPENNDGAKVCAEEHGNNCNDGSAGCTNNEINNGVPLSNSVWRHDSHSPHVLGTSVSPHTPLLGTSNIAAGTALHLPAVLPPTHPLLETSNITAGTTLHLPAAQPPAPPCLGIFGTAAGTSSQFPAVLPRGLGAQRSLFLQLHSECFHSWLLPFLLSFPLL
ncbi:unnamed protein product [Prunus brigantina]